MYTPRHIYRLHSKLPHADDVSHHVSSAIVLDLSPKVANALYTLKSNSDTIQLLLKSPSHAPSI